MSTRLTTDNSLDQLMKDETTPKVSVFFPVHEPGQPHHTSETTAHRLMSLASSLADQFGDPLTVEINRALDEIGLEFEHPWGAIGAFVSPQTVSVHSLPMPVDEEVLLGTRFQLTPLIPLVNPRPMRILTITRSDVHWYEGNRWLAAQRLLPGAPAGLAAIQAHLDPEKQLQHHSVGDGSFGFHGHEAKDEQEMVDRYLRAILDAVVSDWDDRAATLVVIAPPDLVGRFANMAAHRFDVVAIGVNPTGMETRELHTRAIGALGGRPPSDDGPAEVRADRILAAALEGRVGLLRVDPQARIWGTVTAEGTLVPLSESHHDAEELVNRIVFETLTRGGAVEDADDLDVPMSASLRF